MWWIFGNGGSIKPSDFSKEALPGCANKTLAELKPEFTAKGFVDSTPVLTHTGLGSTIEDARFGDISDTAVYKGRHHTRKRHVFELI